MTVLKTWGRNGSRLLELTAKAVVARRERTAARQSQFRLLAKSDRLLPAPAVCSTPMCLMNRSGSRVLGTRGAGATARGERTRRQEKAGTTYHPAPNPDLSSAPPPSKCASTDVTAGLKILVASWWPSEHSPHSTFCTAAPPPLGSVPFRKIQCTLLSFVPLGQSIPFLGPWLWLALLCPRAHLPPSRGASSLGGRGSAPSPWRGLNHGVWSKLLSFPC